MKKLIFIFINLFVLLAWSRPEINVRRENKIENQSHVSLGAIAEFHGFSKDIEDKLKKTVVIYDWDQKDQTLNREKVSDVLHKIVEDNYEFKNLYIAFKVPDQILISSLKEEILNYENLRNKISGELKSLCDECNIEISSLKIPNLKNKIKNWKLVTKPELKASQILEVSYLDYGTQNNNQKILDFNPENNQKIFASLQMQIKKNIWTTNKYLNMGDRIQEGDLSLRSIDISNFREKNLSAKELIGQVVSKSIGEGQALFQRDLKREALVQRGQNIKITSGSDNFEVSTSGISEESGFLGDRIKVKLIENNKILFGKIEAEGKVKLE